MPEKGGGLGRVKGGGWAQPDLRMNISFVFCTYFFYYFLCYFLCHLSYWRDGEKGSGEPHFDGRVLYARAFLEGVAGRGSGEREKHVK